MRNYRRFPNFALEQTVSIIQLSPFLKRTVEPTVCSLQNIRNLYQKSVKNIQNIVASATYISLNLIFYIPSLQDVDRFLILPASSI